MLDDAKFIDGDEITGANRTWGVSLDIGGKNYATSLFWQPLQNQEDPLSEVAEASEGILEGADLYCIKPGKAPQFGICVSQEGYKRGQMAAAVTLSTALADRSSFIAVFKVNEGWWYTCVRNDIILSDGDMLFLNEDDAKNFVYIQKRSGQLLSKQRFFSAQILGYLNDDLWIDLAKHANSMAKKLDTKLKAIPKIRSVYSVHSNELFLKMPKNVAESLWKEGFEFYYWDVKEGLYRFVTSWDTSEESIDLFIETAKKLCNSY